jgi:hypothetical protein
LKGVVNRASLKNCHSEAQRSLEKYGPLFRRPMSAKHPRLCLLKHLEAARHYHLVKPQELDQHNHDAEAEVEIPGRGARQDRRNFNSISVQSQQQPSLPLHDEISDGNVKACDQQAKAEACDFEAHISMVTRSAVLSI